MVTLEYRSLSLQIAKKISLFFSYQLPLLVSDLSQVNKMKAVKIPVPAGKSTTIILLIVKCLLLLVALTFALISLGVFAKKNNDIKKFTEDPFSDN